MFEELSKHITTDEGKAALKKAETNFTKVKTELETNEKKLIDVISSRDKYKNFTKLTKKSLGIEEGEELNNDILKEKISGLTTKVSSKATEVEDVLKKDIENLQNQIKENQNGYDTSLSNKEKEIFDINFKNRSSEAMKGLKLINEKAYDMIHRELSSSASFSDELNEFVYKNENGTVKRNTDGTPTTVEQRAQEIKTSDDFSFFFSAADNSGSGTSQSSGNGDGGTMTEYEKIMAATK